jgi:hypothetical protein
MTARVFSGSGAVGFALAASALYGLFSRFGQDWLALAFFVTSAIAAYHALGCMVEGIQSLLSDIRERDALMSQRELIAYDPRLTLAELLARMSPEQLAVYRDLASAQYDPYDPQSVILDGFQLLTKAFAVEYFAMSEDRPRRIGDFNEGRTDRQREQARELLWWLITEGFVLQADPTSTPVWSNKYSRLQAMGALNLLPTSETRI